jgi:uncharacterized protein (TIGR02444 family)
MSAADTPSSQGSPFWRFSLRFYRQPNVADACIALQEEAGVDVNLLLFLLWHATRRRAFSTAQVADLEARVGPWRSMTVVPLRSVRRALKTPASAREDGRLTPLWLVEGGAAEAFRTRIKAVELEAERLQQEAMYQLATAAAPLGSEAASAEAAARANLAAYESMCTTAFPKPATETVLAAFMRLEPKPEE